METKQLNIQLQSEDWAFVQSEVERLRRETGEIVTQDQVVSTLTETGIQHEQECVRKDAPVEQRGPKIGEVWREIAKREEFGGGKFVIRHQYNLATVTQFPKLFEFVCDSAHSDGDFNYLCGSEYCRCMQ